MQEFLNGKEETERGDQRDSGLRGTQKDAAGSKDTRGYRKLLKARKGKQNSFSLTGSKRAQPC